MAQKKLGRPPIGDKRMVDRIYVLVNDEMKEKLEYCKTAMNATTSDVVRLGIEKIYKGLKS
ncbi:MAG: CopG family transcriptional regulator [Lachnospiraceae bacterium]|nr:CopG family transcriptional regulator [Lachnospiraceae bacterium]